MIAVLTRNASEFTHPTAAETHEPTDDPLDNDLVEPLDEEDVERDVIDLYQNADLEAEISPGNREAVGTLIMSYPTAVRLLLPPRQRWLPTYPCW